jgi:hypothetical protein
MNIEGTIKEVFPEKKTTSASFKEFLLVTNETYPQTLKFSLKYNNATQEIFDVLQEYTGSHAKVEFNISGREWEGKHYVQLNAWKVIATKAERRSRQNEPVSFTISDDLPF